MIGQKGFCGIAVVLDNGEKWNRNNNGGIRGYAKIKTI